MQIKCSGCSATIDVPPEAAGKKVRCPKCQTVLAVPGGSPAQPAAQKPPQPQNSGGGASASGKIVAQCPNCSKKLQVPAAAAGKKVKCPGCSTAFVVPASGGNAAPATANPKAGAPRAAAPVPAATSQPAQGAPKATGASKANDWVPPWEDQTPDYGPSVMDELTDADMAPVKAVSIPGQDQKKAPSRSEQKVLQEAAADFKKERAEEHSSYMEGAKKEIWISIGIYSVIGFVLLSLGGFWLTGIEEEAKNLSIEGQDPEMVGEFLNVFRTMYVLMICLGIGFFVAAASFMQLPMISALSAIVIYVLANILSFILYPLFLIDVYVWIGRIIVFGLLVQAINNAAYLRFVKSGGRDKDDSPEAVKRRKEGNKWDAQAIMALGGAAAAVLITFSLGGFFLVRSYAQPLPEYAQNDPNAPEGFDAYTTHGVKVYLPKARSVPPEYSEMDYKAVVTPTWGTVFMMGVSDYEGGPLTGDALGQEIERVLSGEYRTINTVERNGKKGERGTLAKSTRFAPGQSTRAPLLNVEVYQDDGRLIVMGTAQETGGGGNIIVGQSAEPELEEVFWDSLEIGPKPASGFLWW